MWERFWQWIFPDSCIGCGASGVLLCAQCVRRAPAYTGALPALGADRMWIGYAYTGTIRTALLALKYAGRRRIASVLAAALIPAGAVAYDVVLAIPAARSRVAKRGYDQAVLLADAVAQALGVPRGDGLIRAKDTIAQAHLDRETRARNVADAFIWRGPMPTGRVLLVDDICTTGATMRAAIAVLRAAGCTAVDVAVVARGDKKPPVRVNGR